MGGDALAITGKTRLFVIIADPVYHLRTPQVFNDQFEREGTDSIMVAAHVAPENLGAFVIGLRAMRNLAGLIVTIPHKQAMTGFCDQLAPTARRVGSVNAVRISDGAFIGENFDGTGFVNGLSRAGYALARKRVLLLGSGGAAAAIAFALADAGVASLAIWNRTLDRADGLAACVRADGFAAAHATAERNAASVDLIVNATSLGLQPGDPLPLPASGLGPQHMVAEVVMSPETTKLLETARGVGAQIHLGRHMLEAQLDAMGKFVGAFE